MNTKKYLSAGIKRGKKLDHYKMLQDINNLVDNDFSADMEMRLSGTYTRDDSRKMAKIIAEVYSIAHCLHCHACQKKYLT